MPTMIGTGYRSYPDFRKSALDLQSVSRGLWDVLLALWYQSQGWWERYSTQRLWKNKASLVMKCTCGTTIAGRKGTITKEDKEILHVLLMCMCFHSFMFSWCVCAFSHSSTENNSICFVAFLPDISVFNVSFLFDYEWHMLSTTPVVYLGMFILS